MTMRRSNILRRRFLSILAIAACSAATTTMAGDDVIATGGATVLKTGPRTGNNGTIYFNIQGKASGEDGKYASFGVLDFPALRVYPNPKSGEVKGMTLTLVQSLAQFAKDGRVKFYLSADANPGPTAALKFDGTTPDGLAEQLLPRHPLGKGTFTKVKTGQADSFALTLDDGARAFVKAQAARGGTIRIVVVPDDDTVAATYFGAGIATPANRPKLTIDAGPTP
jgi:hypothetical protein